MRTEERSGRGLVVVAILIALAAVVPHALLRGIESFAGAFLFWTVFGAAAIAAILHVLRGWRV
ncbi:MAG: hypothetical protein U5K43_09615 [Halofilum sp. (in: g-proteobacteria)]|nr:hypothetical protein [Halofilum sp. (in: g-proteobacteria)]